MNMTKLKFSTYCASALAIVSAAPAFAQTTSGTAAGTSISNTAQATYSVGNIAQPQVVSNTDSFVIDRKINLTVAEVGGTTTTVIPGQTAAVTTFTLTNNSNATLDFAWSAGNTATSTSIFGASDIFDVNNIKIFKPSPSNTTGNYADGVVEVTYIDDLAPDQTVRLFVVADIPAGRVTNEMAGVRLTATAREGGTTGVGAALTQTAGANTPGVVDTVFADTVVGPGDTARNAAHSADDSYTIRTAQLTLVKSSRVILDPVNNATNPKAIPGATIEYCIAVTNAAGGADAAAVNVTDTLPAQVTFVPNSIRESGTLNGTACDYTTGTAGGSITGNVVTGTIAALPAGQTRTVMFQVTLK
jgi:uncharacterized repeat protein (TIGR01451 family)